MATSPRSGLGFADVLKAPGEDVREASAAAEESKDSYGLGGGAEVEMTIALPEELTPRW